MNEQVRPNNGLVNSEQKQGLERLWWKASKSYGENLERRFQAFHGNL